jgi:NTP pyrophosphatase (non-canonical NTP hydrolase)
MKQIYEALRNWFGKTFGQPRDPYAIVEKLKEELVELEVAVDNYEKWNNHANRVVVQKEMADVMILIINLSTNYGMCYDSFLDAIRIKHAINTQRTWDKKDNGTYKHIDENE